MKNILIYTGQSKKFSKEDSVLVRIQIDNSLDLSWDKKDILLVTDFPYEYKGISALQVPDGLYYSFDKNANKVPVISYLINQGIIERGEVYWSHDLDAFQNVAFNESELGLRDFDLGLTHYSYKPEWQCGSLFFKSSAKDVIELIDATTRAKPHLSRNNEKTLTKLIKQNAINPSRYKRMNVTYNIMKKYLKTIYNEAEKPLKVLHFRPSESLEIFMYGKNRLKMPLMSSRLIKIFNQHGVK